MDKEKYLKFQEKLMKFDAFLFFYGKFEKYLNKKINRKTYASYLAIVFGVLFVLYFIDRYYYLRVVSEEQNMYLILFNLLILVCCSLFKLYGAILRINDLNFPKLSFIVLLFPYVNFIGEIILLLCPKDYMKFYYRFPSLSWRNNLKEFFK